MESQTLMIRARRQLSMTRQPRLLFRQAKAILLQVLLICTAFHLAACGPCSENGMQSTAEYEACNSGHNAGFQNVYDGDGSPGYLTKSRLAQQSLQGICSNSNFLCFPSTLPGYFSEYDSSESIVLEASAGTSDATLTVGSTQARNNLSWSSDYGTFMLSTGRAVSCSLNSQSGSLDDFLSETSSSNNMYVSSCGGPLRSQESQGFNVNENSEMIKSGYLDGSLSPHIEISPPLLDWGQNSLYVPSFAFLTVANIHSDNILFVYQPFSTNSQFYPCNFSEVLLRPGEVASICFVFLPTWLGMSSAHLILQTSSGGFLVQAKGFAVESPYRVQLLVEPDISSNGRWRRNLSLLNPFNDTLSVEEVTMWVSVSSDNVSHVTKTMCKIEDSQNSEKLSEMSINEWLDLKSDEVGVPLMAMRLLKDWDIAPGRTETIMELDFLHNSEGNTSGIFCMQLVRSAQGNSDTVVVPLEAGQSGESTSHFIDPVSVSLEPLPSGFGETSVFAISLRNTVPYLLSVIRIGLVGEGSELFQMKYLEGLMLFPGSVTQVAVISTLPNKIHDCPSGVPDANLNCRLTVLTNDSTSPLVEVLCKNIMSICSNSDLYPSYEQAEYDNARMGSLGSKVHTSPLGKAVDATEPGELVLRNWKSHGIASGMSVLDHHEVMFPVVQVGTHHSKWITVSNPSEHPVLMQLILNSGEIIDGCKAPDGFPEASSSSSLVLGEYALQTRYGFSITESALTEAYVHPYETASLGPIVFHPSMACVWRSSALIRNNLSGVEWLHLQGFGGSFSLVLFEGSKSIQNLEFKFNLPSPLNFSPDNFRQMDETTHTCSKPLLKELYAKNMGDLPLKVKRIEVSGTECGLDGFVVHTCKGFALQPGESTKLLISYIPDFSAVTVQRDLELALGRGILVIPMKASLPLHVLNLCKKSMFWMRLKKLSFAILLAACLLLLLSFYILPQSISLASQDYFLKSGKRSNAFVRRIGKTPNVHHNQKKSTKFSASSKMNGFLRLVGEEETLVLDSANRYPDGFEVASKQGITAQQAKPTVGCQGQTNHLMDNEKGTVQESRTLSKSSTVGNSDVQETSNLTIRIGKEKGKRRRKKKGSVAGLTGIFEVSSSQSGNSTPSSPLSPVTSFTPKRLWSASSNADQSMDVKDQSVQLAEQQCEKSSCTAPIFKASTVDPCVSVKCSEKCSFLTQEMPSPPIKIPGKPVLLQSATFPTSRKMGTPNLACRSPFSVSTSTIAPHARAPGSKLYNKKAVEAKEKVGLEHQFQYDIWGDHIFGRQLIDGSKKVYAMTSNVMESHSDSFFVSGPQTSVTKSLSKTASCSFEEG